MLDSLIKIAVATPDVRVADPTYNATECASLAKKACENGASLILFPELTVSSASIGDIVFQSAFIDECEKAVESYLDATKKLDIISFIGVPLRYLGKLYNVMLAIKSGEILGASIKDSFKSEELRYFSAPSQEPLVINYAGKLIDASSSLIYENTALSNMRTYVCFENDILSNSSSISLASAAGATLILTPGSSCELALRAEKMLAVYKAQSLINKCAIASASPSSGESTTDFVYSGRASVVSLFDAIDEKDAFSSEKILYSVVDFEAIEHERIADSSFVSEPDGEFLYIPYSTELKKTDLASVNPYPFVSQDEAENTRNSSLTLKMQATALARRFEASHSKALVIGVSGGLDSTLALIVCAEACDILSIDRKNIIAVTMPCFGTTERTKNNAVELSLALGASLRTVDIKKSVLQHFEDISHDENNFNVVYENAQARERTQVLMDIANELSGIVVGTGDLSELALGFATYNGDHMSNYGVNCGVAKTQLRSLVSYYASKAPENVSKVLYDVLKTPVSPELLPPRDGEIAQCTEGIVGPYELHDFFLYYVLRFGFSPRKIKRLALCAFKGIYDENTVDLWLRLFIRRFVTQQFKRSALPDGVSLSELSLSPRSGLKMPSDAYFNFLLSALDGEI